MYNFQNTCNHTLRSMVSLTVKWVSRAIIIRSEEQHVRWLISFAILFIYHVKLLGLSIYCALPRVVNGFLWLEEALNFSIIIALPLHAVIIYWSLQFVDVPQEWYYINQNDDNNYIIIIILIFPVCWCPTRGGIEGLSSQWRWHS